MINDIHYSLFPLLPQDDDADNSQYHGCGLHDQILLQKNFNNGSERNDVGTILEDGQLGGYVGEKANVRLLLLGLFYQSTIFSHAL